MGFNPAKKNSTAITIIINPISLSITLLPVLPRNFIILVPAIIEIKVNVRTKIIAIGKTIF